MELVVDDVKEVYRTEKWQKLLGKSRKGVRQMVLWALSKKEVDLEDRLNGITVEQARATGILMLEKVNNSNEEKYTINVPMILLRAINKELKDIPDKCLDTLSSIDDREFERVVATLRVLRQNMLVAMKVTTATYRDLYPNALGHNEDLDQKIQLNKLEEVWTNGKSSKHDSIHRHKLNAVPILYSTNQNIDLSKGGFYVHNVHMAPSNDGLIVHPPTNIEGIQCKSSDNITHGEKPDPSSNGVLRLGLKEDIRKKDNIWAEFNKVMDDEHKKFYSNLNDEPKFNLFVVSNKPLTCYGKNQEGNG